MFLSQRRKEKMADDSNKNVSQEQDGTSQTQGYRESDFIPLDDLVYAPLHALAKSNHQLRSQVVEAIKDMGTSKHMGADEVINLESLNIAFNQVRPDGEEGYSVDNLQMEVPLLSIVPLTNLAVEKASVDFSTEVRAEKEIDGNCRINARICSPEQRESDFLPRVSYKLEVKSTPAMEGILRLTDQLSSNQIAKRLDTTPVAVDGNLGSDEQKNMQSEINKLKEKVKRLKQLNQKITALMTEQEKLEQISQDIFAEDTREFDKEKYLMAQSNITNKIMDYQEQIMTREIEFGLYKDYE